MRSTGPACGCRYLYCRLGEWVSSQNLCSKPQILGSLVREPKNVPVNVNRRMNTVTRLTVDNPSRASVCVILRLHCVGPLLYSWSEPHYADSPDATENPLHLALERGPMSQERSMPVNPGEDVYPMTANLGGTFRPSLTLSSFGDRNIASHTSGRYWSLLNDPGLTPPPLNPRTPMSDQAPSGDAAKRPEPSPNASAHSFLDPDTLSSDSTDSLREQLHLVNQRIDDVRRTLRMKDERGEGPLRGSPFIQEIQGAPIPSHFHLLMLEAYDGRSDPMEHVAMFLMHMTLSSRLFWSLVEQPPTIVPKILQRANEYIAAKILVAEKREDQKCPRAKPSRGPPLGLLRRRMERGK
ncbi:hypothetical protein BHM03_00037382 [Ensete ventricosum]|nr:hypothetical protein BHM03_00037382 [Ensete ventricosum]